nr:hypothetical protein [uncultured Parasphingorhabdus sp.]
MNNPDQKKEDEVLKRMLKTPPKPHKEKGSDRKAAPKDSKGE